MDAQEKINFKIMLKQKCISIIEERIQCCYNVMAAAQASANNEEKSSAGDKYETGRAMSHIEKDMHAKQMTAHKHDLAVLLSVDCNTIYKSVVPGSFVKCNEVSFLIAAGLGKIFIEKETIYLLSPYAPVIQLFQNKKINDSIIFMDKQLVIKNIY